MGGVETSTTVVIIKMGANLSWFQNVWVRRNHDGGARFVPSLGGARSHGRAGGKSLFYRRRAPLGTLFRALGAAAAGAGLSAGLAQSRRAQEQLAVGRDERRYDALRRSAPAAPGAVGSGGGTRRAALLCRPASEGCGGGAGDRRNRLSEKGPPLRRGGPP